MYKNILKFTEDGDATLRKSYKQTAQREQPVSFCNMSEILGKFESGDVTSKDRRDERKEEIRNIRNRMFMVNVNYFILKIFNISVKSFIF